MAAAVFLSHWTLSHFAMYAKARYMYIKTSRGLIKTALSQPIELCQVNLRGLLYCMCLHFSAGPDRNRMISLYLDADVEINVCNQTGYTALYDCVFQSIMDNFSLSSMKLLVQAGSHVDISKLTKNTGR